MNGYNPILISIFEDIQSDINIAIHVKDKLSKAEMRFSDESLGMILQKYYLLKIVNNHFNNCMLMNKNPEYYERYFNDDIFPYFKNFISENSMIKLFKDVNCENVKNTLLYPMIYDLIEQHKKYLSVGFKSIPGKLFAIRNGKLKTLAVFFSFITFLYGFRFLNTNIKKLIFYVQPYYFNIKVYNKSYFEFFLDTWLEHCLQFHNDYDLHISFRFCGEPYVETTDPIVVNDLVLQCIKQFPNMTFSFVENTDIIITDQIKIGSDDMEDSICTIR